MLLALGGLCIVGVVFAGKKAPAGTSPTLPPVNRAAVAVTALGGASPALAAKRHHKSHAKRHAARHATSGGCAMPTDAELVWDWSAGRELLGPAA